MIRRKRSRSVFWIASSFCCMLSSVGEGVLVFGEGVPAVMLA